MRKITRQEASDICDRIIKKAEEERLVLAKDGAKLMMECPTCGGNGFVTKIDLDAFRKWIEGQRFFWGVDED